MSAPAVTRSSQVQTQGSTDSSRSPSRRASTAVATIDGSPTTELATTQTLPWARPYRDQATRLIVEFTRLVMLSPAVLPVRSSSVELRHGEPEGDDDARQTQQVGGGQPDRADGEHGGTSF